jgi:hypothetical protein
MRSEFDHHPSRFSDVTPKGICVYQDITERNDLENQLISGQNQHEQQSTLPGSYATRRARMKLWIASVGRKVVGFFHSLAGLERPQLHSRLREGWEFEQ